MYKIENEEDWNVLVERIWFNHQDIKEFPGAGFYLAIEYGNPYYDRFIIVNAEEYVNELQKEVGNYVTKINNAIECLTYN